MSLEGKNYDEIEVDSKKIYKKLGMKDLRKNKFLKCQGMRERRKVKGTM